jgi:hypothetical protein
MGAKALLGVVIAFLAGTAAEAAIAGAELL